MDSPLTCPACGARLRQEHVCHNCRLVLATYRPASVAGDGAFFRGGGRRRPASSDYLAIAAIAALAVGLRVAVDPPPFALADALICGLALLAAFRFSGVFASSFAFLALVAADFFLIEPRFQLGIWTWGGVIQLALSGAVGVALGAASAYLLRHQRVAKM